MLEYAFETVAASRGVFSVKTQEHREIIQRRAKQGWRFAGWIPAVQKGYGYLAELDLIFERETEGET